jgi:lipopolysaccharide/colanic/teichoic acid biosynthesis glycosyltransferase
MQAFQSRKNLLLFIGDIFVLSLSLVLTLGLRYQEIPSAEVLDAHLVPFALLFGLWVMVYLIAGLYDQYIAFNRKQLPSLVLRTQVLNMALGATMFFIFPFAIAPKTNLVIYLVISTILLVAWRLFVYPKLQPTQSLLVLLIGASTEVRRVRDILVSSPHFKQVSIEHIDTGIYTDTTALNESLSSYFSLHHVDLVVADMADPVVTKLAPLFVTATFDRREIGFFSLAEFYERLVHQLPPSVIKETWLLEHLSLQTPHYAYDISKRTIDIVGAVMLLLPCIIIFPVVAWLVWRQDRGAVFYKTVRIGQYNKPITILKFRTMTGTDTGTEALKSTLRVTRIGSVLRKTRLDELPQLINVIKGELSFIGPRPEMPALVDVYIKEIPYYGLRHLIKPGLSGWAQIHHFDVPRQGVDIERTIEKLSYDLYYLRNRSLFLDIEIALKTIKAVVSRTGT